MKLSELPFGSVVAVDTEGSGLHPDDGARISIVSYAFRDPNTQEMCSGALPFDQGVNELPLGPKDLPARHEKRLKKWPEWASDSVAPNHDLSVFRRLVGTLANHRLVYQNAKYDMFMFAEGGLRGGQHGRLGRAEMLPSFHWDTMLGQRVLEPECPTGLKPTASRLDLLDGVDPEEDQRALAPWLGPKSGKNADPRFDLVPWPVIEPYATLDAELTYMLYEYQQDHFDLEEYDQQWAWLAQDFELMKTLYKMEQRGIRFDAESCRAEARKLHEKLDELAERLPFKGGTGRPTPVAARQFFFGEGRHEGYPDKLTEGGQQQVDEEVITRLCNDGVEWAAEYEDHESVKSALAKWYDPWPEMVGRDGRLRTIFRQGKVSTGRLAVERVQLQAIPHDRKLEQLGVDSVRSLFEGDEGWDPWEFDVSQAEIRIATALAQCPAMLKGIVEGVDSHSTATREMFGMDPDDPRWDEFRQVAKRCNLGILYGAGARTIQEQIAKFSGITYQIKEVKEFINRWKRAFPEFADELERQQEFAERHGYVLLYNDRPRPFADYEPTHKAFNNRIQGSLAEVMNRVMIYIEKNSPTWVDLIMQVHDSVILEVRRDHTEEVVEDTPHLISDIFAQEFTTVWNNRRAVTVPFESDAKQFGRSGEKE